MSLKVNRFFMSSCYVLHYAPITGVVARALSSVCKTDRANFTDWMPFLPSNIMEQISPNTVALSVSTLSLSLPWKH